MSAADNRELLRRYLEDVVPGGDREQTREYLHPDAVVGDGEGRRLDDHQETTASDMAALELTLKVEDTVAEGDKVAARITIRGTQVGEFMGLPATGKQFAFEEMVIAQFRDRRISRIWRVFDLHKLLSQLAEPRAVAIEAPPGSAPGADARKRTRPGQLPR
jgi:predicted ester cyclase